jgi:ATP-dependent Clp protease ATP-binding subunit ClpB
MKAAVMGVVQAHFRPEFINRLDDIVVFHPLDKQQIKQIARIQMRGLEAAGRARPEAGGLRCGVRPARQRRLRSGVWRAPVEACDPAQLENPLAQQILSGAFVNGDTIEVGNDGGRLVFAKA